MAHLETDRLIIRTFRGDDLEIVHRILTLAFGAAELEDQATALAERGSWLEWSILNQEWLPRLHQAPYGDLAVALKEGSQRVIGVAGYVPLLDAYDQIPELGTGRRESQFTIPEFGLFWAIDPAYQRQGYATETARALIEHGFKVLHLRRILATTDFSNVASQGVMLKAGMKLTRNPLSTPSWLQVVGVIENH
jgi:RimJ/RimL family protein N-acetyltransferase